MQNSYSASPLLADQNENAIKTWVYVERWFGVLALREHALEITNSYLYIRKKQLITSIILPTISRFGIGFLIGSSFDGRWYVLVVVAADYVLK